MSASSPMTTMRIGPVLRTIADDTGASHRARRALVRPAFGRTSAARLGYRLRCSLSGVLGRAAAHPPRSTRLRLQGRFDPGGERGSDPRHGRYLLDRGLADAL